MNSAPLYLKDLAYRPKNVALWDSLMSIARAINMTWPFEQNNHPMHLVRHYLYCRADGATEAEAVEITQRWKEEYDRFLGPHKNLEG